MGLKEPLQEPLFLSGRRVMACWGLLSLGFTVLGPWDFFAGFRHCGFRFGAFLC